MKWLPLTSFVFLSVICISSCYNDKYDKLYPAAPANNTTCDTSGTISYTNDIAPIIALNCYSPGNGCHDAGGSSTSGYNYTTYAGLVVNVADGSLLSDINWMPARGHNDMPKNASQKLPQCDINKITRWINEGYPDN